MLDVYCGTPPNDEDFCTLRAIQHLIELQDLCASLLREIATKHKVSGE
jgi:hypothetical protein